MTKVNPEIEAFARIKVIGVGNSGNNSVNHMIRSKVKNVEFIAVDTDAQKLHQSMAGKKIHIGKNITKGLGGGMNPEMDKKALKAPIWFLSPAAKGEARPPELCPWWLE